MIVPDIHIIKTSGFNYEYHHAQGPKLRKYFKKKITTSNHFVLIFKIATFPTFVTKKNNRCHDLLKGTRQTRSSFSGIVKMENAVFSLEIKYEYLF